MFEDKLAALKIKVNQSITGGKDYPVDRSVISDNTDADKRAMALEKITQAWKSKGIQRHLLAVAPATIKKTA